MRPHQHARAASLDCEQLAAQEPPNWMLLCSAQPEPAFWHRFYDHAQGLRRRVDNLGVCGCCALHENGMSAAKHCLAYR